MLQGLLQIGDVIKADDSWCIVALSPMFTVPTLMIRQNLERQDRERSDISYSGPLISPYDVSSLELADITRRVEAIGLNLTEFRQKYFIVANIDNRPKYGSDEDKHRVLAQETDERGNIKTNLQVTFNQLGTDTSLRMKKPALVGSRLATIQFGEFNTA